MRLAIVTAYCREDRRLIERCIESVRSQAGEVEHILVADGHPQEWIPAMGLRHVALDRAHADFGDTPRLVGLGLAIRGGYDAVQFLDADNLVYPGHAAMAAATLRDTGAHMLVLKRRFLRPDGSVLNYVSAQDETLTHIDTNCYLFARPSFPTAIKWALVPRQLSFVGDQVFRSVFSKAGHPVAVASEATVGYTTLWRNMYTAASEEPPPGCREPARHVAEAAQWWAALTGERRAEIHSMLGVTITFS